MNPRDVACPLCGAKIGSPCMRPSGYTVFGGGFHAGRIQAAERKAEKEMARDQTWFG